MTVKGGLVGAFVLLPPMRNQTLFGWWGRVSKARERATREPQLRSPNMQTTRLAFPEKPCDN
jgi:hypothetical protein